MKLNKKHLSLIVFVLVLLIQLLVPGTMIWKKENTLKNGKVFYFKTAPVDPTDPFRGKYITLNFEETDFKTDTNWKRGETAYAILSVDNNNFARVAKISKEAPNQEVSYFKTKIDYTYTRDSSDFIEIDFPFNRFYMEESKAYDAELSYLKANRDSLNATFAVVNLLNGDAVLKDVMINQTSLVEIVKEKQRLEK